jgi:hypothetical protein
VEWIYDRVSGAIRAGAIFRVIAVLPQHPEGDYCHAESTYKVPLRFVIPA